MDAKLKNFDDVLAFNGEALKVGNNGLAHKIVLLAKYGQDGDGNQVFDPIFKTAPNEALTAASGGTLGEQEYLRVAAYVKEMKEGAVRLSLRMTFRPVFASDNLLFDYLLEQWQEGNLEQKPDYIDAQGETLAKFELKQKLAGEIVTINFPDHYLIDRDGNRQSSVQFRRGEYVEAPAILNSRTFFFLDGENRLAVANRYYRRFVEWNLVDEAAYSDQEVAGVEQGEPVATPTAQVTNPAPQQTQTQQPKSARLIPNQQRK